MIPKNSETNSRKVRHNLKHRFELVKTLGQGTYGKVKLAVEKATGFEYAVKTIKKQKIDNEQDLTRIRREIEIMATLNHPHITSVYEVFENAEKIILVMEYASGGELYDYINDKQGLYEEEARKFYRQIVSAAHYLHMNGIVHRDLKLENIVLDRKGNAMIADFGLANIFAKNKLLSTYCGSPLYASPEIVNGLPYTGPEVDCWSLGVLLFTLVYGAMPFDGSDFRKLRNQITAGNYYEPDHASDAAGLIRHLLTPNPAKRATIHDICDHWWTNLGYDCTPVEDTVPGKPVNYSALEKSLSKSSYSSSDSDSDHHDYENSRKPIKGILKKGNKVDPKYQSKNSTPAPEETNSKRTEKVLRGKGEHAKESTQKKARNAITAVSSEESKDEEKPRRGILKNTNQYSGSDSGCVIDETVGDSMDKDSASATLSSHDSADTEVSDTGAQTEYSEANIVLDDSYELGDIESVLDDLSLDRNTTDNQLQSAGNAHATDTEVPLHSNSSTPSAISEEIVSETSGEIPSEVKDSKTPSSNQTMFNNACNTARELFDSITTSNPARRIRGILKKNGKFANGKMSDPTWRYSAGSAGSTSSGDFIDFSYDSGEGDILNIDPSSLPKHCLVLPEESGQPHPDVSTRSSVSRKLSRQSEVDEDDEDSPPPPLPTSPPPVLSSSLLRELENSPREPGELNFDDIDTYELGEIKYQSDESGISRITIKHEDDDIINKINFFDEELSEDNECGEPSPPNLFDLADARGVYQKALEICKW